MLDIHTKGYEPYLTPSQQSYTQEICLPAHCLKLHGRKNHRACSTFFSTCARKISHIISSFSVVYVMQCVVVGPQDMATSTAIYDLPDRMRKHTQENHLDELNPVKHATDITDTFRRKFYPNLALHRFGACSIYSASDFLTIPVPLAYILHSVLM